jgi:hypothetical protein
MGSIVTVRFLRTLTNHLVFIAALWVALGSFGAAKAAVYSEDAVKAAFLHRFSAYVEWPSAAANITPFTIGVLNADGVVAELEHLLPGLTIQNRVAQVRKIDSANQLEGLHILFIGARQLARAGPLISAARARPILVVTDEPGGLERGAIVNFVPVGRNLRLEISLTAAERSGLKINSGLLSVAVRVVRRPQADSTHGRAGFADTARGQRDERPVDEARQRWVAIRKGAVMS